VRGEPFLVGLDGEGLGRAPHRYTLLAWSDARGARTASVANVRGLSTARCLAFLLSLPENARPFGYYLQYDWTKILADLPNKSLYMLFRPALRKIPKDEGGGFVPVRWREYELHYLAGMMRVRCTRRRKTVVVWDVGRFFQAPFCDGSERSALVAWKIGTAAERKRIAAMKAKRSEFSTADATKVRAYCLNECRLLAQLVAELNRAHDEAGLHLRSWHGPGSTASIGLRAMGIQKKRGEIPMAVAHAALHAFFGGRFEHSTIGIVKGPIHGADIISAYPAACLELPCLEHGRWERVTRERALDACAHAVVRYRLRATGRQFAWGPLPCRLANGSIVFPRSGSTGWVWRDEYQMARKHWPNVEFLEAWVLRSDCECHPFERVLEWFNERRRIGKSARGIVLKLFLNSLYGKLAQCVGDAPFRSRVWAGMITSATRAKLLHAIVQAWEEVLGVATDGVYSTRRLDLPETNELGDWEHKRYGTITLVRPGIYWTDDTVRARGIGRKHLSDTRKMIVDAIKRGDSRVELPPVQQFGGALACVYVTRDGEVRRAERYGEWFDRPARISLEPGPKRADGFRLFDLPDIESSPYGLVGLSNEARSLKKQAVSAWGSHA
jgi:DNA polymerase family B